MRYKFYIRNIVFNQYDTHVIGINATDSTAFISQCNFLEIFGNLKKMLWYKGNAKFDNIYDVFE